MKRLFFIFCLLASPVAAQEPRSRETDEIIGPVQTVRMEKAAISKKAGKVEEGSRVAVSSSTYDQMRNLIESSINKPDGSVFRKYAARYAAAGSAEESYFNSKGALDQKFVTAYDQSAKKAETVGYNSKGSAVTKTVYTFDDTGRIAEEVRYDKGERVSNKTVFAYDEGAGKQERKFYDGQGRVQYSAVTTMNSQGKPADEKYYRPDGSVIVRIRRAYDNQGNCNDEVYDLGAGGLHWRYDYEYDSRGNWTKRRTFKQILNEGLPEYEPVEATYRVITYFQSPDDKPSDERKIQAVSGLLSGEAVERRQPYNPGRNVGTGVSGQIAALVMIDEHGDVLFTRWISGFDKSLNDAAEIVTKNWKYNPTLKGGRLVTVINTITFDYKPDFR